MDRTTELLSSYACNLSYEDLSEQVIHQVKRTVADTLGCAIGGFLSEPAKVARKLAGEVASGAPSRIMGTNDHSSLDLAGFANGGDGTVSGLQRFVLFAGRRPSIGYDPGGAGRGRQHRGQRKNADYGHRPLI